MLLPVNLREFQPPECSPESLCSPLRSPLQQHELEVEKWFNQVASPVG